MTTNDNRLDLEQVKQRGIEALRKLARIYHLTFDEAFDAWMELYSFLDGAAALSGEQTVTLAQSRLLELEALYAGKLQGVDLVVHPSGKERLYRFVLDFARRMKGLVAQGQQLQGNGGEPVAQFPLSMLLGLGPVMRVNPGVF